METILLTILWKRGARLDKLLVLKNVGRAARYVGNNYGAQARVVLSEAQIQLAARNTPPTEQPLVTKRS